MCVYIYIIYINIYFDTAIAVYLIDEDFLTPTGYPPPQHSNRHRLQRTQHTAS